MKVRFGFVSNSSSTSFTCDVCGEETSGMDMSTEDAGMYSCGGGHTFCEGHIVNEKKLHEFLESKEDDDDFDEYDFLRSALPAEYCPICQMLNLTDNDELKYYRKKLTTTNEATLKEVKEKFEDYEKFEEYIK